MQNYKYYATINAQNEKRIFDDSKEYVMYKYRNRASINCKGFNNIPDAHEWLAKNNYTDYNRETRQAISWDKYPQVFQNPIADTETKHINIYVGATRDRTTGCGAYGIIMKSPQYSEKYQTAYVIPANQVKHGVSDALVGIIHACRMAYDNGFTSMTVYATSRHAINWLNGSWQAKCDAAMDYLLAMDNLILDKGCTIYPMLVTDEDMEAAKEHFGALTLAQFALQK